MNSPHIPVLLNEVLVALQPQPGLTYVDATLGAGGHARALLERITVDTALPGLLYGVDQDPTALRLAEQNLQEFSAHFCLLTGNFSDLPALLPGEAKPVTGGILADIGVSSMQLDTGERGFSFLKEAPLDMRMGPGIARTAAELVNTCPEAELVRIFSEYGEEHLSKTIARSIVDRRQERPFSTTTELAGLIAGLYGARGKHEKIHPATRVFQALRIAVNDELGSLRRFLENLPALLAPGARVAVISFHSLEDRIVKEFFQRESRDCICPPRLPVCQCGHRASFQLLNRKPVTASPEEIRANPRARSAKLRAAVRL